MTTSTFGPLPIPLVPPSPVATDTQAAISSTSTVQTVAQIARTPIGTSTPPTYGARVDGTVGAGGESPVATAMRRALVAAQDAQNYATTLSRNPRSMRQVLGQLALAIAATIANPTEGNVGTVGQLAGQAQALGSWGRLETDIGAVQREVGAAYRALSAPPQTESGSSTGGPSALIGPGLVLPTGVSTEPNLANDVVTTREGADIAQIDPSAYARAGGSDGIIGGDGILGADGSVGVDATSIQPAQQGIPGWMWVLGGVTAVVVVAAVATSIRR